MFYGGKTRINNHINHIDIDYGLITFVYENDFGNDANE